MSHSPDRLRAEPDSCAAFKALQSVVHERPLLGQLGFQLSGLVGIDTGGLAPQLLTPPLVGVMNFDDSLRQFLGHGIVQRDIVLIGPRTDPFPCPAPPRPDRVGDIGRLAAVGHELLPDRLADAFPDDRQALDGLMPEVGVLIGSHQAALERIGALLPGGGSAPW